MTENTTYAKPDTNSVESVGGSPSLFASAGASNRSYFRSLFDGHENPPSLPKKKKTATRHKSSTQPPAPSKPESNSAAEIANTSAFLTHCIVGAPHSILLGKRQLPAVGAETGLAIGMKTGLFSFSAAWSDWCVLSHDLDKPGKPKEYPSKLRLYLERHALVIALFGIFLSSGAVFSQIYFRP